MTEEWKKFVDHPERHPFAMKFSPFKSNFKITKTYTSQIPKDFKPHLMNFTLLRQILYRRSKGMNTFIYIFGNVRSGKSWTGLKLCELYMKENKEEFDVDKQVSFTLPKFLRWSSTTTDSCFMVDEIQLSMGAREWWTVQHRVMNQFCDIQGFRRNLAIFTLPNVSYVDKHIRFLCNYYVVTINQGFVRWGKHWMRHELGKGGLVKIGDMDISMPSPSITEPYEDMKKKFNDEHLRKSLQILEELENPTPRKTHLPINDIKKAYLINAITEDEFREIMTEKNMDETEINVFVNRKEREDQLNLEKQKRKEEQKIKREQSGFKLHCNQCGNDWRGKSESPRQCPKCNSRLWNG